MVPFLFEGVLTGGLKLLTSLCNDFSYKLIDKEPQEGDVIAVKRPGYIHFGIYAGKSKVIHFASVNGDFGSDICVHEARLNNFKNGSDCLVVKYLSKNNSAKFYSPDETLKRAREQIGDSGYNLFFNNCEHFASWCKTGYFKSEQVDNFAATAAVLSPYMAIKNQVVDNADKDVSVRNSGNKTNKVCPECGGKNVYKENKDFRKSALAFGLIGLISETVRSQQAQFVCDDCEFTWNDSIF